MTKKTKKKFPRMTPGEFASIKAIFAWPKMTTKKVRSITGRGINTLAFIKKAEDFSEYCKLVQEYIERYNIGKKKVVEVTEVVVEQTVIAETTPSVNESISDHDLQEKAFDVLVLRKWDVTNVLLKRGVEAIERLATAWEAKPPKTTK